jgi:putative membrane protein insertion efficiency factor
VSAAAPPPLPPAERGDNGPRWRGPWRRRWTAGCLLLLGALAVEQALPPARQPSARLLLAAIDGYQAAVSPGLRRAGVRCRFRPTCSRYAEDAIRRSGAVVGSARAAWRLLRCGPWTPAGTIDPA